MLRRKNNEPSYGNTHLNQSPYRFERKNQNVSPGLSPMRCRTPTRISHISPLRGGNANDNYRGHSPIKFVNNRTNNQNTVGFFRNDTSSNFAQGHSQKYATCTTKNDHSFKRQLFQEHENNSRIRPPQQNSDRTMLHENTKLFSKLVEKLNSQKKKQPQLVKRHTKPQTYKPSEPVPVECKTKCSQKTVLHKPSTQKQKIEPFVNQIIAVESVVYEEKQTNSYYESSTNYHIQKQTKTLYHYQQHKNPKDQVNNKNCPEPLGPSNKSGSTKVTQEKTQTLKNIKNRVCEPQIKENIQQKQKVEKISSAKKLSSNEKQYKTEVQENDTKKTSQFEKNIYQPSSIIQSTTFDDVKMYLGKLTQSPAYFHKKDESFSNNSDIYSNMNGSLMNMDPFI